MRKLNDFLTSYCQIKGKEFVPEQYTVWSGLSAIAGALERKVWFPVKIDEAHYPNLYIILVGESGAGKTTALKNCVGMLQEIETKLKTLNMLPTNVTAASFISSMLGERYFDYKFKENNEDVKLTIKHCSAYYFAPEAQSSLKNVFGDFIAILTDLYDCHKRWEKRTEGKGLVTLENLCINMISATTPNYLADLITDENILGGFASRVLYVYSKKNSEMGNVDFPGDGEKEVTSIDPDLFHDLCEIHKMAGPMIANDEAKRLWKEWWRPYENWRRKITDDRLKSVLARTHVSVLKVSILLSASESDDRIVKRHHMERAIDLVTKCNADIPGLFREAKASKGPKVHGSLRTLIMHEASKGPCTIDALKHKAHIAEFNPNAVNTMISSLIALGMLERRGSGLLALKEGNHYF